MSAIFVGMVLGAYTLLCLCSMAKRGDQAAGRALGVDLGEPNYRAPRNRRGHRLGKWLAFNRSIEKL